MELTGACTNGSDEQERFCMSKDEFISATKTYQKRSLAYLFVPLLLVGVFMIACAPLRQSLQGHLASYFSETMSDFLTGVVLGLPLILLFVCLIPLSQSLERKFGVACPHCGKNLAGTAIYKGIVIATRNCPLCGMKVLDEESQNYA
jgi:DNA-directed RNA polymerase subunit RPC12/RpoP